MSSKLPDRMLLVRPSPPCSMPPMVPRHSPTVPVMPSLAVFPQPLVQTRSTASKVALKTRMPTRYGAPDARTDATQALNGNIISVCIYGRVFGIVVVS